MLGDTRHQALSLLRKTRKPMSEAFEAGMLSGPKGSCSLLIYNLEICAHLNKLWQAGSNCVRLGHLENGGRMLVRLERYGRLGDLVQQTISLQVKRRKPKSEAWEAGILSVPNGATAFPM